MDPIAIVTDVFVCPALSAEVAEQSRGSLRAFLEAKVAAGVNVTLTSVSAEDAVRVEEWYWERRASGDTGKAFRFVTPGAFHWPGGTLRLPTETALPTDAVNRARAAIAPHLPAGVAFETPARHDFLTLTSVGGIDPAWIRRMWDLCNAEEILLASDPDALESLELGERRCTVLAPEAPSTSWRNVVRAEGIDPRRLLILATAGDAASETVVAFVVLLNRLADELERGSRALAPLTIDPAAPEWAGDEAPTPVFAPRICAPSTVHFLGRWSLENQRYVRENLWRATKRARANAADAAGFLQGLDGKRFFRAADVVVLAGAEGGARLFDDYSGGVCFDPGHYEFELPALPLAGPARRLRDALLVYFDVKMVEMAFDRPLLKRRLFTNSMVLLRGEAYYTNLKQVSPWLKARDYAEEADAFNELVRSLQRDIDLETAVRFAIQDRGDAARDLWKLLLAACDQARNLGLAMLSVAAHHWGDSSKPDYDENLVKQAVNLVDAYYAVLLGDVEKCVTSLFDGLRQSAVVCADELRDFARQEEGRAGSSDWYDPGAPIRGWREADNPCENLLTALLAVRGTADARTAALGMFWGGVELPIVARVAANALDVELGTIGFIRYGRYSSSASRDDGTFCDLSTGRWRQLKDLVQDGTRRAMVLDDNALSGRTLESARDMLIGAGVHEVETWVVRFSGERREGQMRMNGAGIVQPSYLEARMHGFLRETPYARSYSKKQYQSPVGVFDTARARILRYLHNNGFVSIFEREGF